MQDENTNPILNLNEAMLVVRTFDEANTFKKTFPCGIEVGQLK